MSTITTEQLDSRLEAQTERILGSVKRGFDELTDRIQKQGEDISLIKKNVGALSQEFNIVKVDLATLTTSVDRFAKIYTDLNQEFVVMRQHLRDVETRVEKLEMRLKAA